MKCELSKKSQILKINNSNYVMSEKQTKVILDLPAHSQIEGGLTYCGSYPAGLIVRVPLGHKVSTGITWIDRANARLSEDKSDTFELKPIVEAFDALPLLNSHWQALVTFTASYYQRSLGEVALQALPPELRKITAVQLQRRLNRLEKFIQKEKNRQPNSHQTVVLPELTIEQKAVLQTFDSVSALQKEETGLCREDEESPAAYLLYGVTGSGKTEVYMRLTQKVLDTNPEAQVLVLVPEINLTPQLESRFQERFPGQLIVSMHSGMTPAQRLQTWLLAHMGQAQIVLGTRMAVFASMPSLNLIVVDEEQDPSYKQYEGARWSARDLAVWRGRQEKIPVILGSATPSLETWLHAQKGHYKQLDMPSRLGSGAMPKVRILDMRHKQQQELLAPELINALQSRINHSEQSLVLLNRRGYAPVLYCASCGWKSQCPHCTALRVFHRIDRSLRCHHCGYSQPVPKCCPECGDPDIKPVGQGTEKLEELLTKVLVRADGRPVHVLRIDADSTRHAGELAKHLQQVHEGDVDILVGTQMIAKGHDFRRMTLVAAINPDTALLSSDFRAGERLFALLMQVAGRGGRDKDLADHSELWVQTTQPDHPLFDALKTYDFSAFANATLVEREMAAMPPYSHLALVRAEARTQEAAQAYLSQIYNAGQKLLKEMQLEMQVILYPPIPAAMQRIANVERGQMMVESASRKALQNFLAYWRPIMQRTHEKGLIRWAIDIDPLSI